MAKLMPRFDAGSDVDRSFAVKIAGQVPTRGMLPLYEKALSDSAPNVRVSAIRCLTGYALSSAKVDEAMKGLVGNDKDPTVRKEASLFYEGSPQLVDDGWRRACARLYPIRP